MSATSPRPRRVAAPSSTTTPAARVWFDRSFCAYGFSDAAKSIAFQQPQQAAVDTVRNRRPLINHPRPHFHQRRARADFLVRVRRREDAADANDGQLGLTPDMPNTFSDPSP